MLPFDFSPSHLAREKMQSNAFTSAQSLPSETLTFRRIHHRTSRLAPRVSSQRLRRFTRFCISDVSASTKSLWLCSSSRERVGEWSGERKERFELSAAASDEVGEVKIETAANGVVKMLELGVLFGLWIVFNIYFNIYNKQVSTGFEFFLNFFKIFKIQFVECCGFDPVAEPVNIVSDNF